MPILMSGASGRLAKIFWGLAGTSEKLAGASEKLGSQESCLGPLEG